MKILVIAPRFPSLNQPWIDTYLEQLLKNDIDFNIYSNLDSPDVYNSKVDRLGLRDHLLGFKISTGELIRRFLQLMVTQPVISLKQFIRCLELAKQVAVSPSSRIISTLRLLFFLNETGPFKDISLIHSHSELYGYLFLHLSLLINVPLVLTFHGLTPTGVRQLDDKKRAILYENVTAVLVNTAFARQQVINLGAKEESVRIIPQGLPLEDFDFHPCTPPNSNQPLRLITVGRFHRDKGHRYALLALKRLIDTGYNVEWHFVGVGSGVDELKQFAARLDINEQAHFHVALPDEDMRRLYQECHVFVLTSVDNAVHIETQGVVIQEAQASGCLVIATRVGGVPECIHDHKDGLLVPPRSSRELYNATCFYIKNPEVWEDFLKSGLENVRENFSADVIGQKMAATLQAIADTVISR